MKMTKILPLALALAITSSGVFAATSNTATSTMTLTVPEFINITRDESMIETANATFTDDYKTINLDNAMSAKFTVITNKPGDKVKISATALADGGQTPALFGSSAEDLKLVLTNEGSGKYAATVTAIENCKTSPAIADNANAICFSLKPTITPDTASGAKAPLKSELGSGDYGVTYTIDNGKYGFSYVLAQTAEANTFSTHDTHGTYKATLTLSQVNQ